MPQAPHGSSPSLRFCFVPSLAVLMFCFVVTLLSPRLTWQEHGEAHEREYGTGALVISEDLKGRCARTGGEVGESEEPWHLQAARGDSVAVVLKWGVDESWGAWLRHDSPPCAVGLGSPEDANRGEDGKAAVGAASKWKKLLKQQALRAVSFGGECCLCGFVPVCRAKCSIFCSANSFGAWCARVHVMQATGLLLWPAALVMGVGVVHQGDMVTFSAAGQSGESNGGYSLVGCVECIFSVAGRGCPAGRMEWNVGDRVEALWKGRVSRGNPDVGRRGELAESSQRMEQSVCDFFTGEIVAQHPDGSFDIKFDDGEVSWGVPADHLRDLRGNVGVIVKRYYRPQEIELSRCDNNLLLNCKGEVLESSVWECVPCERLDCLRAMLTTLSASEVLDRDRWFKKSYDSWTHLESFRAKVDQEVTDACLHMVCANFYDGVSKTVAPVVKRGMAKMLLSTYKASSEEVNAQAQPPNEHPGGFVEGEVAMKDGSGCAEAGVGGNSAQRNSVRIATVGVHNQGPAAGKSRSGAGAEGSSGVQLKALPKYAEKLEFLNVLDRKLWPSVQPVLVGPQVQKLLLEERIRRLHILANEYLRVYHLAGEKGRKLAFKKAAEKEKAVHDECAKRGETVDLYRGKMSKKMKTAKDTAPRNQALAYSDDEEAIEVDDAETIARKTMLNALKKQTDSAQPIDWTSDWQCRKCKVNVWARNFECFKCGAPRVPTTLSLSAFKVLEPKGVESRPSLLVKPQAGESLVEAADVPLCNMKRSFAPAEASSSLSMRAGDAPAPNGSCSKVSPIQGCRETQGFESRGGQLASDCQGEVGTRLQRSNGEAETVATDPNEKGYEQATNDVCGSETVKSICTEGEDRCQEEKASAAQILQTRSVDGAGAPEEKVGQITAQPDCMANHVDADVQASIVNEKGGETHAEGCSETENAEELQTMIEGSAEERKAKEAYDDGMEEEMMEEDVLSKDESKSQVGLEGGYQQSSKGESVHASGFRIPRLKPNSADSLLKDLVEKAYQNADGKLAGDEWKYFEFRSSTVSGVVDSRACFDDDGWVFDEALRPHKFDSLAQWAKAIKKRTVSVKPVIFFQGRSLREYENGTELGTPGDRSPVTVKAVSKKSGKHVSESTEKTKKEKGWRGPQDPQGVDMWVALKISDLGDDVSGDGARNIVRKELDDVLHKYLSKKKQSIDSQSASIGNRFFCNVRETMEASQLYADLDGGVEENLQKILSVAGIAHTHDDESACDFRGGLEAGSSTMFEEVMFV